MKTFSTLLFVLSFLRVATHASTGATSHPVRYRIPSNEMDVAESRSSDLGKTLTNTELVKQWKQVLTNCRLNYFHTYRSYTGGFTRVQLIDLCPQGFYSIYTSSSFDLVGQPIEVGSWEVQWVDGAVMLVLTPQGGTATFIRLGVDQKQNILLNNKSFIPQKTGKYGPRCQ